MGDSVWHVVLLMVLFVQSWFKGISDFKDYKHVRKTLHNEKAIIRKDLKWAVFDKSTCFYF